jgi:hypothetical protein
MRDPEFAQAYREADLEVRTALICESLPFHWQDSNAGVTSAPTSEVANYWAAALYTVPRYYVNGEATELVA